MITLTAKINILGGLGDSTGQIEQAGISIDGNNISATINDILAVKRPTNAKPFILGKSILGTGYYYASNVGFYIGRQLSDNDGQFPNTYRITVSGRDLSGLAISFNDNENEHPQSITVDDGLPSVVRTNTAVVSIDEIMGLSTHTIEIDDWNAPYKPLVISGIFTDLALKIDDRNLREISSSVMDRGDTNLPYYGIYSNSGEIAFIDTSNEVRMYAEQMLLKSGLSVEISIVNVATKASKRIAVFKTSDWDYRTYNNNVTVQLVDDLQEWQEITIDALPFDGLNGGAKPLKTVYEYLYSQTPSKYNMPSFEELDVYTQNVLKEYYVSYPMLQSATLWDNWDKLAVTSKAHIFKDNNKIFFKCDRGVNRD